MSPLDKPSSHTELQACALEALQISLSYLGEPQIIV